MQAAVLIGLCAGRADNDVTFVAVVVVGFITANVSTFVSYNTRDGGD